LPSFLLRIFSNFCLASIVLAILASLSLTRTRHNMNDTKHGWIRVSANFPKRRLFFKDLCSV
jgi:hypothetical protein